jgi:hypothetical protein
MTDLTIKDVRAKFPQYEDLSDEQLATALHRKFYSDLRQEDFFAKIGLGQGGSAPSQVAGTHLPSETPADTGGFDPDLVAALTVPSPPLDPKMVRPESAGVPTLPVPAGPDALPTIEAPGEGATGVASPVAVAPISRPETVQTALGPHIAAPSPDVPDWIKAAKADQAAAADIAATMVAPADPFEGEALGALAGRRGQQFARGATEAIASIPEALELARRDIVATRLPSFTAAVDALSQERDDLTRIIAEEGADSPRGKAAGMRLTNVEGQIIRAARAAQEDLGRMEVPIEQSAGFAAGSAVRETSADVFGTPDPRDVSFWSQVAEGAGNMTGMLAVSALGAPLGPGGQLIAGAASGSAMNAPSLYKEAIEAGADEETARRAARWGAAIGATEIVPINRALKLLPPRLRGKIGGGVMRRFADIAQGTGEEAAQEYLAQVANNIVAQQLYDPERGWTEGATEAALVGAVLGGGVATVGTTVDAAVGERPADVGSEAPVQPSAESSITETRLPADVESIASRPPVAAEPPPQDDRVPDQVADSIEIMDEVENDAEGRAVPTGRKVAVNTATGQVSVVDTDEAAGEPAGAPGGGGSTGEQPQSQSAPEGVTGAPAAAGSAPSNVEFLDERTIQDVQTDAVAMQYKAGGDEAGVTERLKGISEWKPERAGMSLIYERADGSRVVADGHQRLGLAKRLAAEGKKVQLPATILREVDGVTPADARVAAALKNIAEGSGSAIDAAKVLRQTSQTPAELGLPPNSALVRDAAGLQRLSDRAFGMVVNGVSSEQHGGIVGRVVEDQAVQADILALLNKLKPSNAFQAESIARQAAADTTTETQDSLFGPETLQQNFYLERAKILDAAIRRVKDDIKTFKTLVDRSEKVQAEGNILNAEANQERLAGDAAVRDYLGSQANMKGPISDALSEAARKLKSGAKPGIVTGEFLAAVERALEGNGQDRPGSGEGRQAPEPDRREEAPAQGAERSPAAPGLTDSDPPAVRPSSADDKSQKLSAPSSTGRPQRDLFDQSGARGPGERQTDIEDLIAEKAREEPADGLRERVRAKIEPHTKPGDEEIFRRLTRNRDLMDAPEGRQLLEELAKAATLEKKQKAANEFVLRQGLSTGVEHLVVLDREGDPISITAGHASGVTPTPATYRMAAKGQIGYATHNHPKSKGPSGGDIAMVQIGFSPMSIMSHDGRVDRLEAGLSMPPSKAELDGVSGLADENFAAAISDGLKAIHEVLQAKVDVLKISVEKAAAAEAVARSLVLDRLEIVRYTGATVADIEKNGVTFDDVYGPGASAIRDRLGRAGYVLAEAGDRGGDQEAGGSADAASSFAGPADQQPEGDADQGDQGRRVRSEPLTGSRRTSLAKGDTKSGTGNAAIDGALDDLFGTEADNVSSTGADLERDRGDTRTPDGLGAADVPSSGGRATGGRRLRAGASDARNRKPGGRSGLSRDDAAPLGVPGDQGLSGDGRPSGQPADDRDGSAGSGGGAGGLSADGRGGGNADPSPSQGAGRRSLSDAERLAAIRRAFEEEAADFVLRGFAESAPIDQRRYETLEALFLDGLGGADHSSLTDRELFRTIIAPLQAVGMTRAEVERIVPYLEHFYANLKAGRVQALTGSTEDQVTESSTETVQARADRIPVRPADEANIRATLPILLPEQQDDVLKVERRFAKPDGHGMMVTNGTGTGKTFSGMGVIKRFARQGKTDVLIVAPSEAVIQGWLRAGSTLGLDITKLSNTKDAGTGIVVTTYANLQANNALARRAWDLVVTDEAQSLSMNADGENTSALRALRAITHHPRGLHDKHAMLHADEWARHKAMRDGQAKTDEAHRLFKIRERELEAFAKRPRSKVLFLSATPFAYDKTIDYAEGYLFDYPEDGHVGRSRQGGREIFMVQNFGYRIRYHKLTKPETAVDSAVFEREFHERLVREGVLTGRSLQIDVDYDRRFVTTEDELGSRIDAILKHMFDASVKHPDKGIKDGYETLYRSVSKRFSYLKRMQLLEAIKARVSIPDIEKHLALGRKVVVFHDYNVGGGFNPFADLPILDDENAIKALADLTAEFPDIGKLNFAGYLAPMQTLSQAFGKRARTFNGTVPQRERLRGLEAFNQDGSGVDVLIVQSDAGGAGISMHDTTGVHQRVLINLGMPTKPTTTLQEEGRILRVGTKTNAPFRYYTIGTAWERQAFAQRIAERSGTVENLALGNGARALREGFIDAYLEASALEPGPQDGIGGKEKDRGVAQASPFAIAKTHYFARMKTSGRRDQREGLDFYPTPEPLGLKMVQWAGIRPNERVLEPSAGDGAIARYMPEGIDLTLVEPSIDLGSRAQLRAPQGKHVGSTFESYHLVNKHHVVVMNPPFGSGGKTAFDHLAKAMNHLREGGRIVALVPAGPTADRRLDALDVSGFVISANISLPAVTFERAGTSVMSRILVLDKIADETDAAAQYGQFARIDLTGASTVTAFFDRIEGLELPRRPEAKRDVIEELEAETEHAASPARPALQPPLAAQPGEFKLTKTVHSKNGGDLFVACPTARVERDVYSAMLAVARSHGGWYSSFRGAGAIPGFQFKSEEARNRFLEDVRKPVEGKPQGFAEDGADFEAERSGELEQRVPPNLVRESTAAAREIARQMPALRRELDRLDLKRVRLVMDTRADWQAMFAVSGDGFMEITIGASLDPMKSLHHEALHAMRSMNLFTPEEWRALELAATRGWLEKHAIHERYPDLTLEQKIEEAIAEEFADALEKKRAPRNSLLVHAFNKIARFLRAIRNVFQGAGFQTAEDIFGRALAGEITRRRALLQNRTAAGQRQSNAARSAVAELTGKEIGEATDIRELGRVAETWYRDNLLGKAVVNTSTGWKIDFNRTGARKIGGRKGEDLYRIVAALPEILEKGSLVSSEPDRSGRPDIKAVHKIAARVLLAGRAKDVIATVRETKDGTFHYDLSRDMSDGAHFQSAAGTAREAKGGGEIAAVRVGEAQVRSPALEGNPVELNLDEAPADFNEAPKLQRQPAIRPLTAQGRAHRNSAMQGPIFVPDRRVWEELTRASAPIWDRLRSGRSAAADAVDRARVIIQDRFLPILRAQQAVEQLSGRPVSAEQNAYVRETTFSGRVGRHLFEIDEDFTKPIIQIIAATNGRLTVDDVGEWLYARHALERNRQIASINPRMPDGGSGMTDAEAQQIIALGSAGPNAAALDRIGELVDQLREMTLRLREEAGLITHKEANLWRSQYRHYVPLKGFAETDHSEAILDLTGVGRRFNVRGQESKRALGRRSEAFNPLQAAITQAQEVAIRAEKNRVGQALYELAKDYPSPALWSVKKPKQRRYYNRSTGLVETRVEDPVSIILEPNEMAVKVGGEEVRILFHDERVARAAGTVGADQMNGVMRLLSLFARYYSISHTMLNPEFMVTNAFRDFQSAQFNIQGLDPSHRGKIAKAMAANWRKAFLGVMRGQRNEYGTEWAKYYREFQKAGGQISFWTMENPVAAKEDLDLRVSLARGSKAARALKVMTTPRALFSMRDNAVLDFIERTNLAVDNAIRLAAFVEARKLGWTADQAAFLAKELTVNFNRRGEAGPTMNALYPFFNAAIQGSVRTVKALSSRRVAKLVLLAFAAGALNDMLNAALSDDDEDGEKFYDKVPDWRSERNFHLVLWGTGNNPVAIPMPYGYNLFPYAGQQLGKVVRGVKKPEEALASVARAAFGAFSPINGSDFYATITPTIGDPLLEMARNQNWTGIPIYPREWAGEGYLPDSQLYFDSATMLSRWVAQSLNSLTGGDQLQPGAVDISPETMDHLSSFVVGSAGAFWGRTFDVVAKSLSGNFDEIERRDVPFLRTITSPVAEFQNRERYYRFTARVKDAEHDRKRYVEAGIPVPAETAALATLYPRYLEAQRELRGQGKWNQSKEGAMKPRAENTVHLDFARQYLQIMGRQAE